MDYSSFGFGGGGYAPGFYGTATTTTQTASTSNQSVNSKNSKESGENVKAYKNKRKLKCLRKAGGEIWEDSTLDEWPENDFRIFCGNLGNEVTDDVLTKAFNHISSFAKAKVVRDKRTGKTKGFGFVSILNSEDYARTMREMEGKYVGNRPVQLTRSKWKERSLQGGKSKVEKAAFKKIKREEK